MSWCVIIESDAQYGRIARVHSTCTAHHTINLTSPHLTSHSYTVLSFQPACARGLCAICLITSAFTYSPGLLSLISALNMYLTDTDTTECEATPVYFGDPSSSSEESTALLFLWLSSSLLSSSNMSFRFDSLISVPGCFRDSSFRLIILALCPLQPVVQILAYFATGRRIQCTVRS